MVMIQQAMCCQFQIKSGSYATIKLQKTVLRKSFSLNYSLSSCFAPLDLECFYRVALLPNVIWWCWTCLNILLTLIQHIPTCQRLSGKGKLHSIISVHQCNKDISEIEKSEYLIRNIFRIKFYKLELSNNNLAQMQQNPCLVAFHYLKNNILTRTIKILS